MLHIANGRVDDRSLNDYTIFDHTVLMRHTRIVTFQDVTGINIDKIGVSATLVLE